MTVARFFTINVDKAEKLGAEESLAIMMNDDVIVPANMAVEWRCWREDRTYGPPCDDETTRDGHQYSDRHAGCCRIAYVELPDVVHPGSPSRGLFPMHEGTSE